MQTHVVLSLAILIPGIAALSYGLIVLNAGYRDDRGRKSITLFSLAVSAWLLVQLPLVIITTTNNAGIFFILSQWATFFAAFSYYIVAQSLTNPNQKIRKSKEARSILLLFASWSILVIVFPTVHSINIDETFAIPNFNYNTVNYGIYLILPVGVMIYAFAKIAKSKDLGKQLKRDIIAETAYLVSALIISTFIIPVFIENNLFIEYCSVGLILVVFLFLFGRTVLQGNLVDLRQNSWRVFIDFAVKALVVVVTFSVIVLYINGLYSKDSPEYTSVVTALVIYTATLTVLLKISGKLVKNYLEKFQVDVLKLTQTVQRISYTKGVAIFSEGFLEILASSLGSQNLALVVCENAKNNIYSYKWRGGIAEPFYDAGTKKSIVDSVLAIVGAIEKNGTTTMQRNQLRNAKLDEFSSALVLKTRGLSVALMIGPREDGSEYSQSDLSIINSVANEFTLTVENAIQFDEIKQFNITLQKKIEDATHKLQHSNEKLKALDEAKDEFISMASHQLRTPLTSIKGYVSMVLEGDAGKISPKQTELLNSAFTSSQRMVYLISDLLNVSRLRTGKFVIEIREVYLPDVVEGEVTQLKETAKNRKLKLIYKKPKTFPTVMLDETKIRQVIMNFADNAIYYTPAGGTITVALSYDKHSVTYKVVDTGIGVPKEEQHKLFSKFYRAGNAKKARPDGTGLGLFMAKKVVIAQGGAILFETHDGKGSTFGFTFPRSKVDPPTAKKKA